MDFALVLIVAVRLAVPLGIPRWPLPAIVLSLVVDAGDQTLLTAFGALPDDYQEYDKALDVYYLAVAYISTLRNWPDGDAFRLSRFLWYYRLVGVAVFEFTGARLVLLLFPNTFEYFFIFYETVRTRWDPAPMSRRFLLVTAAVIWVGIKLPQEWWVHWAKLDVTSFVGDHVLVSVGAVVALAVLVGVADRLGPPRPEPDWEISFTVDARPTTVSDKEVDRPAYPWSLLLRPALEKLVLAGLVTATFSQLVPRSDLPTFDIVLGILLIIGASVLLGVVLSRDGSKWIHAARNFAVTGAVNTTIVMVIFLLPTDQLDGGISMRLSLFLVALLTMIVALYDRYRALRLDNMPDRLRPAGLAGLVRSQFSGEPT